MDSACSRKSDITTLSSKTSNLFDFSFTHIPGLYRITSNHFLLDYKEGLKVYSLSFRTKRSRISANFYMHKVVEYGIEYESQIQILHDTGEKFDIVIPGVRSYDPAGIEAPYLNYFQYSFIKKLVAIEVRAASSGISEDHVDYIKEKISGISETSKTIPEMTNWVHLQIKLACFKKSTRPKYFEYLLSQAISFNFSLNERDHCKEYLEKCLNSEEFVLPIEYYKIVLDHEPNLSFDKKIQYSEVISKENRLKNPKSRILINLPKVIPNIAYVKQGKSYNQLLKDSEKYVNLVNEVKKNITCKVM
jgi:hypothetical protein